jgi:hypothetical protein
MIRTNGMAKKWRIPQKVEATYRGGLGGRPVALKPLVILNLFQDNTRWLFAILKQVQDDEGRINGSVSEVP